MLLKRYQIISKKILLSASVVALMSGVSAFAQEAAKKKTDDGVAELEDVVVYGIRGSLKKALDLKRNADQLVDAISSEDIGKFPDQNIAESLQRISGVQIQRGQDSAAGASSGDGEGSTVSVRGMRPDLNKVTINGNSMSSTTGGRDFNFSNLAPELVERLEVFKSPLASQDEGAIGGTVNLVTRTPLKIGKFMFVGSTKVTYHELADAANYRLNGLLNHVFGPDDNMGILLGVNYSDQNLRRDSVESFGWNDVNPDPDITELVARDIRTNLKQEDRKKISINGSFEAQISDRLNFRIDGLWTRQTQDEIASNYQLRVGQNSGNTKQFIFNENGTAVFASTTAKNNNQRFHRVVGFERTDTRKTSNIVGNLDWEGDSWDVSARGGYTDGSFVRDPSLFAVFGARADLTYDIRGDSIWPVLTSSATPVNNPDPSVFKLITLSRANLKNKDTEKFGQIDFTRKFDESFFSSVEFGVKYRNRKQVFFKAVDAATGAERAGFTLADFVRDFPVNNFASALSDSPLPLNWAYPDTGAIIDQFSFEPGGILDNPVIREKQDSIGNFDVSEKTLAGYVQANFENEKIRGNVGVRVVRTRQGNNGFELIGSTASPISSSRSYTNVLPSFNLTYIAKENLFIRFAAAAVMARPTFKELSSGISINSGAFTASAGNPDLDPYKARTFDVAVEWYFQDDALLSAAFFYKDIYSFVTTAQRGEMLPGQDPTIEFLVKRPINGDAKLKGLEFAYQQNFSFLPAPFDGLGVVANYTYVDSDSTFADPNNPGSFLPLPGTSKHSGNIIAFYEKNKFSVRLAYNIRSAFVVFPLSLGGQNVSRDKYDQLDATMTYDFTENLSLVFEATNLTKSTVYDYAGIKERWVAFRNTGRRFSLNARFKF